MLLAIDIGNTTASAGLVRKTENGFETEKKISIPSDTGDESGSLSSLIAEALGVSGREIEGAVLCSVVPRLAGRLTEAVEILTGKSPLIITKDTIEGFSSSEADLVSVGRDRLVDAAYAAAILPCPILTVDMGTATTFNVIGEGRVFLGGMISCGLNTGLWALHAKTAQLPELLPEKTEALVGRVTKECMQSGAVFGQAAMIDGFAGRVERLLGREVSLVITGGWSEDVEGKVLHPHLYEPELMMKGLAYQYFLKKGLDGGKLIR
ncbi:MAG: type III pantothenate kinase [Lachnospiraceae bacterium]|nr:type III pantothenate kinase [Lachnospiraceae bacterium]